jgi:hypothetical protein
MNGSSPKISAAARKAQDKEPIRILLMSGAAVLLLGYLAFRGPNSPSASASDDPVSTEPPQPVALAPVDPTPKPTVTANLPILPFVRGPRGRLNRRKKPCLDRRRRN